ncbi:DMT family transporter [Haemophilus parahaemolyticus]|uniref:DMT family transporter n=2 Tax=Haemophilus parahaemolyticus TaxID=735 RepID=A0AAE6JRV6_HAEPH|nr:DMT family transporter [Haemophilus parahaemolyticus]EIJ70775.1 EamA-like transporter family protein [Haemophilus parahaemolyticus HK385]OOR97060.1 EamA family transporter [Haemophilus parahaemolyticus]QEN10999.1 DMT family transporter [Haemophilus parahaemolyticus]QRP12191.1 DMT family transporter [Haemophilus parahaemolyticus]STO67037.1 sodium/panthothenate symporter [Haemophilus parahaemolyticus HK385]
MFYLLLASFLWGTSFIAGKFAYETLDPALVVLFRLIIAGVILFPITLRFIKENSKSEVNWRRIALLGFLTYPATFLLQFIGLQYTSASSAATMIGIEPLMVILVGQLFFKEKASLTIWLLGTIAFIGVFLLVGLSDNEEISLIGCLLVLASTIVVALWLRLSKSVLGNLNPKVYTALSLQLGTLIGLPFMLLLVKDWNINFSYSSIIALLYLGIGCSLFANWAWNKGLSETETNKSGIFLALEPVFGVLFSIILLNDSLSITSWVGVALVILSAAVCLVLPKKN